MLQPVQFGDYEVHDYPGTATRIKGGTLITGPYGSTHPADVALGAFNRMSERRKMASSGTTSHDIMHAAGAVAQTGRAMAPNRIVQNTAFHTMNPLHPEGI